MTRYDIKRITDYVLVISFSAILLSFILFFIIPFRVEIRNAIYLATHKVEQNFTELYFKSPTELPTKVDIGEHLTFEFVIKNSGNLDNEYDYTVYSQIGDENLKIQNDRVQVKQNSVISISVKTKVNRTERQKYVVRLNNEKQEISFWIN